MSYEILVLYIYVMIYGNFRTTKEVLGSLLLTTSVNCSKFIVKVLIHAILQVGQGG